MTVRRIFIAIDISEAARAECSRHIDGLRTSFPNIRVGWERREKLHITMKFLGNTDEAVLSDLQSNAECIAAGSSRFKLRLASTGVFTSRRRARILWTGVDDPANAVGPLYGQIELACQALGFQPENRNFAPHVTIGRVRLPEKARSLVDAHLAAQIEPVEFAVSAITIYESQLRPTGSVYAKLQSLKLKAA